MIKTISTWTTILMGEIIQLCHTSLIWNLFMGIPEIREGMKKLGLKSPHFVSAVV